MVQTRPAGFVWFWTFWHWSKESFRGGSLLRSPLNGIGSHWDEWFRHEASVSDLEAIKETSRTELSQRQFVGWLLQHWSHEAFPDGNRLIPRFVLNELAQFPPFDHWPALERFRASYNVSGISAIILGEGSTGESEDVRVIEALALPVDVTAVPVVAAGFVTDNSEFTSARRAAMSLLGGQGFLVLVALWIAGGRRPYPRPWNALLTVGWLAVGGLIAYLLFGPDPDDRLFSLTLILLTLWSALLLHAVAAVVVHGLVAWGEGRGLRDSLEQSQVRMRMPGGLTLKGGSAGLAFCLNILQAVYRNRPVSRRQSWLWRRLFGQLKSEGRVWAVTGVLTSDGLLKPVVLGPKIRACFRHAEIRHVFAPYQNDAAQRNVDDIVGVAANEERTTPAFTAKRIPRLGFAASSHALRSHRGVHVAQAALTMGGFSSKGQTVMNILAALISVLMLIALPDIWSTVLPPLAPAVMAPGSPSPYYLWVSLDTKQAEYFRVVLESEFWANRRANVKTYGGANASVRAEISLHRLDVQNTDDAENGVIWIERRYRFLNREFVRSDRVGRYPVFSLNRIDHD